MIDRAFLYNICANSGSDLGGELGANSDINVKNTDLANLYKGCVVSSMCVCVLEIYHDTVHSLSSSQAQVKN